MLTKWVVTSQGNGNEQVYYISKRRGKDVPHEGEICGLCEHASWTADNQSLLSGGSIARMDARSKPWLGESQVT